MTWRYWIWLVAVLAIGVVAFVFGRRSSLPDVGEEIDVINGRRAARELEILRGAKEAADLVEYQHRQRIEALDKEAKDVAARLRDDPVALSEYLIRGSHAAKRS